ncbi:MAG: uracil phosphoribosyltransferase [Bdellovibrionales bacterium]|nr:uracil phosphoribosyltransferase [Bdellovibrionales bacterium]
MLHDLSLQPSLVGPLVAELRDVVIQKSRERFRENLERLGEIVGYEISKVLEYQEELVTTPLGVSKCFVLSEQPVIGTILRAGLPLYNGLLRSFPDADNAFVSAYRKHAEDGSFSIKLEYASCPSLEGRVLVLADPMLATAASMVSTIHELYAYGTPSSVHVVSVLASKQGIGCLQQAFPDAHIWTTAVDPELDSRGYIVPGLGDAGDLAFGEKVQR